MSVRRQAALAVVLGIVAVAAVGVSYLALTDIAHGEADVAQEWAAVQATAVVVVSSTLFSISTLVRFLNAQG